MLEAVKVEKGSVDESNQNTHMHKFFQKMKIYSFAKVKDIISFGVALKIL